MTCTCCTHARAQLIQKVSDSEAALAVAERKVEHAMDAAADLRRQKADLLLHQDNLSKDLRTFCASETARADAAEISAQVTTTDAWATHCMAAACDCVCEAVRPSSLGSGRQGCDLLRRACPLNCGAAEP